MTLVVLPAVRPPSIGMAPNGHISADVLVNVGGSSVRLLAVEAATQYVALRDACLSTTGVFFAVMGGGAYRSYDEQVTLFAQRYTSPPRPGLPAESYRTWGGEKYSLNKGMASAASPGTSKHGYGIAVDIGVPVIDPNTGRTLRYTEIDETAAWPWLLEHAVSYGWSWEIQSENWHLRLIELPKGHAPPQPAPPLDEEDDMVDPYIITSPTFATWVLRWPTGLLGWCTHSEAGKYQQAPPETDDSTFNALMKACTVPAVPLEQQALRN